MCYFDVTPPKIRELIGIPNAGRLVHRLVHSRRVRGCKETWCKILKQIPIETLD